MGIFYAMPEFADVNKILVIKLRHIGDVLLTVPVFRALRETFPRANIAALVNSGTEDVLAGNRLIDDILVYDRKIKRLPFHKRLFRELSFLRSVRLRGYDLAVDLTSGDRAAMLALSSGARYRLAYAPDPGGLPGKRHLYTHLAKKDGTLHMVQQNLDVVRQFGISTNDLKVDFFIPEQAMQFAEDVFTENSICKTDPVVHVHPTSRWLFKCWKDEHMADVINWLAGNNVRVIVTSSPSGHEMKRSRKVLAMVNDKSGVVDLCGKTTIKQLAAISAKSDLFLGIDSAPMHIAAAAGTPVIALFGPSGEEQWKPWGEGHTIFIRKLGCVRCEKCESDGVEVRRCLEAISPAEIITEIRQRLSARPGARWG
jgi:heptosyltransferase III